MKIENAFARASIQKQVKLLHVVFGFLTMVTCFVLGCFLTLLFTDFKLSIVIVGSLLLLLVAFLKLFQEYEKHLVRTHNKIGKT